MQQFYGILKNKPFSHHLLALLFLMIAGTFMAGLTGRMLVYLLYGIDIAIEGSMDDINDLQVQSAYRLLLPVNHAGMLILPVLIWAWLCGGNRKETLCLHKSVFFKPALLGILIFVLSMPMANLFLELNMRLPLPAQFGFLAEINIENNKLSEALVYDTSFIVFIQNVFVFALVPAVSEELMFRAFLQYKFTTIFKNSHTAVITAAAAFSFFHMEVFYFLPRFFLGILLGYLFLFSGNIKYSMWAHFINNLLSLFLAWMVTKKYISPAVESFGTHNYIEIAISITGCLLGAACLWKFKKYFD